MLQGHACRTRCQHEQVVNQGVGRALCCGDPNPTPESPERTPREPAQPDRSPSLGAGSQSSPSTAIAAAVGSAIAAAVIAGVVVFLLMRRRRRRNQLSENDRQPGAADKDASMVGASNIPGTQRPASSVDTHGALLSHASGKAASALHATAGSAGSRNQASAMSSGVPSAGESMLGANTLNVNSTLSSGGGASPGAQQNRPVTLKRIAPTTNAPNMQRTFASGYSHVTIEQPDTLAERDPFNQLMTAVENMSEAMPPVPFAGRFLLSTDFAQGSQGLVVFARDRNDGFSQYAIKCALLPDRLPNVPRAAYECAAQCAAQGHDSSFINALLNQSGGSHVTLHLHDCCMFASELKSPAPQVLLQHERIQRGGRPLQ